MERSRKFAVVTIPQQHSLNIHEFRVHHFVKTDRIIFVMEKRGYFPRWV